MERKLRELKDHYLVCGYGRVGRSVVERFAGSGAPYVVIEQSPERSQVAEADGCLVVTGDASDDEVLRRAGIERARGLVSTLGSDADNVFVTLTARGLNPGLLIVARANAEETTAKLRRAGADHVVSPYTIGGRKMATLLLHPLVSDYLDVVTGSGEVQLRLQEFALNRTCEAVGRSIRELEIRSSTGASILAVRHASGAFETNPSPDLVLSESDMIIAVGAPEDMERLEELLGREAGGEEGARITGGVREGVGGAG